MKPTDPNEPGFIFGDNDDSTKTPSIGRTRASEVRQEVDDYTIFHD